MAVRAEFEPARIGRTLLALLRRSLAAWSVDGLGGARRFYIAGCFGYRGPTVDDGIGRGSAASEPRSPPGSKLQSLHWRRLP